MKRILPALGVPLLLTAALSDTPASKPLSPNRSPMAPHNYQQGDSISRAYMVFGLRTDANGMVFTSQYGAVLPVPSQPHLIFNPDNAPRISVPSAPPLTLPSTPKQK